MSCIKLKSYYDCLLQDDYMKVHDLRAENISSVWAFVIGLLTGVGLMSALWLMVYKVKGCNTLEDIHGCGNNKHTTKLKPRPPHNIRYNSLNKTKTTKCTARRHKRACSSLRRSHR